METPVYNSLASEVSMRLIVSAALILLATSVGCPATSSPRNPAYASDPPAAGHSSTVPGQVSGDASQRTLATSATDAHHETSTPPTPNTFRTQIIPPDQVKTDRGVWAYIDGDRQFMDIDQARAAGFTIVDLSDDWVPYIFWDKTPSKDDYRPNRYLKTYVALANDRIDGSGHNLRTGDHNYLEVYGIPPTLSVLRRRFVEDQNKRCFAELNYSLFETYYGAVRVVDPAGSLRLRRQYQTARAAFRRALRAAKVKTLEDLLEMATHRKVAKRYRKAKWKIEALREMQRRLVCEGVLGRKKLRIKPGVVDWNVRRALKLFERKHNVYGWGMIFEKTAQALGRTSLQNNYRSLRRVIGGRVVGAAGILEDGSSKARYKSADGSTKRVRNLVREFTDVAMSQMGLLTPEAAHGFIKQFKEEDFRRLLVAIRLPPVPEYYAEHMELRTVIDRGDVWYDKPFNDKGRFVRRPRGNLPTFRLLLKFRDQWFPLVRWRTTIGGWKKELRGTEEYYKYKVSDVGPRIWKNIVAGPVWVPPKNTPSTDLVKSRGGQRVVGQSTFGPGYASAYGLVAAFHVTPAGRDNQIRTHGTVNYMSVRKGFSHGCHRLYNYRAVRLFSFVLRHRNFIRKGQSRLAYRNRFEHRGEEYQINLHTRGYYYELTPPVPVLVLAGRIRGQREEPYEDYVKKPSAIYQDDLPDQKKPKASPVQQSQTL